MHQLVTWLKNCRQLPLLTIAVLCVGCQSGNYQARNLPGEFRAGPQIPNDAINFAKATSPGASESILAPGDLLSLTVATGRKDEEINPVLARVADDGTVDVPVIGPVPVAGLEAFEASKNIASLGIQRGMYRHPLVTVEIKSKAVNRVTVLGAVKEPGVHELPRAGSDLVSALAAAGGLNEEAGTIVEIVRQPKYGLASHEQTPTGADGEIQLAGYTPSPGGRHPQAKPGWSAPQTIRIDLASAAPLVNPDYRLSDRDLVRVVARPKEVIHVAGLVHKPGQFELPLDQDVHLLDAIAMAGGRNSPVADKVFVIRQVENQTEPLVIQASIANAKQIGLENLRLQAGDSVSVEQTPSTAVVEAVSKFFRLTFGVAGGTVF